MRLLVRTGAEPERARATRGGGTGLQRPEPVDAYRTAAPHAEQPEEVAAAVRPDVPVAEVTDEQRTGELAEAGRRDRHAPRRVQRAAAGDPFHPAGEAVEPVHEAQPAPGHLVLGVLVLHGVRD